MAVTIAPNLDITQLFSQLISSERSVSVKSGSNQNPLWNELSSSDSNASAQSTSFSAALLNELADQPASAPQNSAQIPSAAAVTQAGFADSSATQESTAPTNTQMTQTQFGPSAIAFPLPPSTAPSTNPLSLVLASQRVLPSKSPVQTNGTDRYKSDPTLRVTVEPDKVAAPTVLPASSPAPISPASAPAIVIPAPVTTPAPKAASNTPNQSAPRPISNSPTASTPADDVSSAPTLESSDSLAFQAHLIAPDATSPAVAAGTVAAPAPANSTSLLPQSDQTKSTPLATSANSTQSAGGDPEIVSDKASTAITPVGTPSEKGQSFGQNPRDEAKPSPAMPTSGAPGAHFGVTSSVTPPVAQNNLTGTGATTSSSKTNDPPIVHQPLSDQTGVKTDMSLKVQGQAGENVTVRVSERAGEIQVTVRSADPATSAMLRHELPSIQSGLEHSGWRLDGSVTRESSGNNSQGDSHGNNDQPSDSGTASDQKRKNTTQDQWFDLMQ